VREVFRYRIATRTFTREGNVPSDMGTNGLPLSSGRVLFAQGNFTSDALIYDPLGARWISRNVAVFQNYPSPFADPNRETVCLAGTGSPGLASARNFVMREEGWNVPRPSFSLACHTMWPGGDIPFGGTGLRASQRIGGGTNDFVGEDEVIASA